MTSKSISQISLSKDSVTCLPNSQLRVAIKKLEKCKYIEDELWLTQRSNDILKIRLNTKDSIIYDFKKKDSLHEVRYTNSLIQIGAVTEQLNSQKIITGFYKDINKKEKKIYAGGGFIAGIITMLVIFIVK